MEYVITTERSFEEIETQTQRALEKQGYVVRRTFSLHSAVGTVGRDTETFAGPGESPGYSVLMLYASDGTKRPLGVITFYERKGRTVINPVFTPAEIGRPASPVGKDEAASVDVDAEFAVALMQSGLEYCVKVSQGEECIAPGAFAEEGAALGRLIQDPVCGRWIDLGQAEAGIEHEGIIYYVCCPVCREEFERKPARYARVG